MRRKFVLGLVLVNALLASAILVKPADTQMMPRGLLDCCQQEAGDLGEAYCCFRCCWWTADCYTSEDCQVVTRKALIGG